MLPVISGVRRLLQMKEAHAAAGAPIATFLGLVLQSTQVRDFKGTSLKLPR